MQTRIVPDARLPFDLRIVRGGRCVAKVYGVDAAPDQETADRLAAALEPLPMVLHCPRCGVQHIDAPSAEWDNPPHRSHACQNPGCGCIWRPADIPTTGVQRVETRGKADNWGADYIIPEARYYITPGAR